MIIQPLTKKNGQPYTNVELTRICYKKLVDMRDGVGYNTQKDKEAAEDKFMKICGGSDNAKQIMDFMKQVVDEPDDDKAQKILARGLMPVELRKI